MTNRKILEKLFEANIKDRYDFVEYGIEMLNNKYTNPIILKTENIVCEYLGINPVLLYGETKRHNISSTRFIIWYFLMKNHDMTLEYVGKFYKRHGHSPVMNGIKRVNGWIETDNIFKKKIEEIEIKLLNK